MLLIHQMNINIRCKRHSIHIIEHPFICWHVKKSHLEYNQRKISTSKILYEDIFKDHMKQKGATLLFKEILELRKQLQEADNQLNQLGPCTTSEVQLNSSDLRACIDDYSSGK